MALKSPTICGFFMQSGNAITVPPPWLLAVPIADAGDHKDAGIRLSRRRKCHVQRSMCTSHPQPLAGFPHTCAKLLPVPANLDNLDNLDNLETIARIGHVYVELFSQAASLVHLIIPWDSAFSNHKIRMIPTSAPLEISCSKGAAGQCCWQSSWRSKGFYPSSSAYPSGNSLRVTVPSALYQSLYSCSEGSAHFQFQSFQLKKILHWLCARRTDGVYSRAYAENP